MTSPVERRFNSAVDWVVGAGLDPDKDSAKFWAALDQQIADSDDYPCHDCSQLTIPYERRRRSEYYMIHDVLWRQACAAAPALNSEGMLCVGCLERRLGRMLTFSDFTYCPLNRAISKDKAQSARLRDRYARRSTPHRHITEAFDV